MNWFIKQAAKLPDFQASDGCMLSEVIHPDNDHTAPGLSLARARLAPGESTKPHFLDFTEVYYIITGQGLMHLDDQACEVGPDSCIYAPPKTGQWLENTSQDEPIRFLCVCHPAYDPAGDHIIK